MMSKFWMGYIAALCVSVMWDVLADLIIWPRFSPRFSLTTMRERGDRLERRVENQRLEMLRLMSENVLLRSDIENMRQVRG